MTTLPNRSKVLIAALFVLCWSGGTAPQAVAQASHDSPGRPSARKGPLALGDGHSVSSFAPRPGAKRRVYGAPIQAPILHRVKPKKPRPPG